MYDGFYTLNVDYCNFDAADENLVFLRSVDLLNWYDWPANCGTHKPSNGLCPVYDTSAFKKTFKY
jgi:hypothetical protein